MATIIHTHDASVANPSRIYLADVGGSGLAYVIKITDRAGAATVDVDEDGGLGRKLVDLASGTADATINPVDEITDNTGTGLSSYRPKMLDTSLLVTSTQDCTVTIQMILRS